MISLAGYTFAANKACFVCQHILDGAPVLGFAHDEDGSLQFVCDADAHETDDWHVIGLSHFDLERLRLTSLPTVDTGHAAERAHVDEEWGLFSLDLD